MGANARDGARWRSGGGLITNKFTGEYTASGELAEGEELGSNLLRAVHSSCRYPSGPDLDREIGEPPGSVSRPSRAVPLGFEITPYQPDP
jgi:hypothetical protein